MDLSGGKVVTSPLKTLMSQGIVVKKKGNSPEGAALCNVFDPECHELRSSFALWALRLLLDRFKRPSTEGLTKYAFARNSFKTPARSYFFLKRFSILSIDSLSFICTLTNVNSPPLKRSAIFRLNVLV
jgi:hypothetical protein